MWWILFKCIMLEEIHKIYLVTNNCSPFLWKLPVLFDHDDYIWANKYGDERAKKWRLCISYMKYGDRNRHNNDDCIWSIKYSDFNRYLNDGCLSALECYGVITALFTSIYDLLPKHRYIHMWEILQWKSWIVFYLLKRI